MALFPGHILMKKNSSLFILWEYMLKRKFGILFHGVLEGSGNVDGIKYSFEKDNYRERIQKEGTRK